jgi:acyl-CoA dehydrogenase
MMNNELDLFRDNFKRFLNEFIAPHYETWEKEGKFPREIWDKLGENGFLCVDIPEEYGGFGATTDFSLMLVEESARAGFSAISVGLTCHSDISASYILHLGTEEQKKYWLPKMVTGEIVGAIAMSEPGAGSDLQSIRTNCIPTDDHYLLNGSKIFITNGQNADIIVMAGKTILSAKGKGVSLFIVPTNLPGFSKGTNLNKLGLHAQDTSELFFEDVILPKNCLLGNENEGFKYMMNELPRERLAIASTAIGAIKGSLDITVQYVKERQAFGSQLSKFQNTRFVIAQSKIELDAAASLYEKCLDLYIDKKLSIPEAASLKCLSTDLQFKIADQLLQLFGGYGYMVEYPISRFFIDARVQKIYGGTNEIMKEIIARSLLD